MRADRPPAFAANTLVVLLIGASLAILQTGGGRAAIGGLDISVRSWTRPLFAATVLILLCQLPRVVRGHETLAGAGVWLSRVVLAALVIAGAATTASAIVHACGGLDSHGYVSASRLFSEGTLRRTLPDLSWLPVDNPADAAAPPGFIPSADGRSVVPVFPPGLPLVMAVARTLAGPDAVYLVAWLSGVALAATIFALTRHRYDSLTAWLATVLVVAHPVVVAYSIQPLSDVPAAMWAALAVWAMAGSSRPRPIVAGLAAVMAFLTRPPLLLPMVVLGVFAWRSPRTAVRFGCTLLAGLLGLMSIQYLLYGSPFVSGHGGVSRVFALSTLTHNVAAHGKWLLIVHTPFIVPLVWLGFRSDRAFARLALLMAAATAFPYFFYGVRFDDWEMVRFLLPGIVLLLPVAAEGVVVLTRRVPSTLGQHLAVVAVAALVVVASARWLGSRDVFSLELREAKYPRVGEWFAARTAEDAIVFASLHSGSVHYYSGRLTLRWDAIPPGRLADVVAAARRHGHQTYLVFDDNAEAERFTRSLRAETCLRVEPIDRILTTQIAQLAVADDVR